MCKESCHTSVCNMLHDTAHTCTNHVTCESRHSSWHTYVWITSQVIHITHMRGSCRTHTTQLGIHICVARVPHVCGSCPTQTTHLGIHICVVYFAHTWHTHVWVTLQHTWHAHVLVTLLIHDTHMCGLFCTYTTHTCDTLMCGLFCTYMSHMTHTCVGYSHMTHTCVTWHTHVIHDTQMCGLFCTYLSRMGIRTPRTPSDVTESCHTFSHTSLK